jgi:hypothetical protein
MLKGGRIWRHSGLGIGLCALLIALAGTIGRAAADDAKALSSRLSDQAFALLNSVSAKRDTPSPLLGPIGVFAADSQKLSTAVQSNDRAAAAAALAALKSDAADVDKGAASGGLDKAKWGSIKHDLDALSAIVPAAPASAASVAAAPASGKPAASAAPSTVSTSGGGGEVSHAPVVQIDSAEMAGPGILRIKGYMSGHAIRSAGIYFEGSRLAKLDVKRALGDQTIKFNLEIHDPVQGSVLRIYDSAGRSAQAPILGAVATGPIIDRGTPIESAPAPSLEDSPGNVALGGGDDFDAEMKAMEKSAGVGGGSAEASSGAAGPSSGLATEGSDSTENTEEIPAAAASLSGPKSRVDSQFTAHGQSDIRIRIDSVSVVDAGMHEYMVRGQIAGSHLKRAAIYVDGRLAQRIPLNSGQGLRTSNFAQSFTDVGSEATIRVYRTRRDFSESSIDLAAASTGPGAGTGTASTAPMVINSPLGGSLATGVNPNGLAVQITSVQPAAPSLYVVSGNISGRNIASAGIYQNGVLAQPLSLSRGGLSGGIGGLLSGLIPGMSRQVSFTGRFNPLMGYATVRAYDTSGMMAEQPIVGGSAYGMNPYGVNPYMRNPYTGVSPYTGVGTTGIGIGPGTTPRSGFGVGTPPW